MRIILSLLMILVFAVPSYSAQWQNAGTAQLPGTINISDIDYNTQNYITGPLDRLLSSYRKGVLLQYNSASQLTASAGEIMVSNSAGTVRLVLRNTSATTITWSDIDTGSEAASTTYYVYAIAATSAAETATFKISASSTAPSGITYYKRIGSFYNNSQSNISYIYNTDGTSYEYIQPSAPMEASYSADTTYQNTTQHTLLIMVYGIMDVNGEGWVDYIGETSTPATAVTDVRNDDASALISSTTFIVPPGYYWQTTKTASSQIYGIQGFEIN